MKPAIIIAIILIMIRHAGLAQKPGSYDSILKKIELSKVDSVKAYMYHDLAGMYLNSNAFLAKFYANKSLELFERERISHGIAVAGVKIAAADRMLNDEAGFLRNIKMALSIGERIKNDYVLAACYHEMGLMYNAQNDMENALKCNLKALELRKKLKQEKEYGGLMNNIGILYAKKGQWNDAVHYFRASIELEKKRKDHVAIGNALNNLGIYYIIKNQADSARYFIEAGKKWREENDDQLGLGGSFNNLALLNAQEGKLDLAKSYADSAFAIAKRLNSRSELLEVTDTYYSIYYAKKDFEKALFYSRKHDSIRKKSESETHNARLAQVQSSIEMEQKEKELLEKNLQLKEEESKSSKRNFYLLLALAGLGFCGFIIFYVVKANKKIKDASRIIAEQKELVEEKAAQLASRQKEILDSIRYAHRIQQALMPTEKYIQRSIKKKK